MTNHQQIGLFLPTKEGHSSDHPAHASPNQPTQTPPSKYKTKLAPYIQLVRYKGKVSYRYNPPQDAVDAGVVKRQALGNNRLAAIKYAEEQNVFVDEWRREQKHLKNLTEKARVRDLIKSYERNIHFKKLEKKTAENYLYYLAQWCGYKVGGVPLIEAKIKDIYTPMVQRVYDAHAETSVSFANHCLAVWRLLFNYAIRHGFTQFNPFSKIKRRTERHRKIVWTKDEVTKFLDIAYSDFNTRNIGLIIQMAYEWGQRMGDMRLLQWSSYNLDTGILTLEQSKRRAHITLPTSQGLQEMLRQQHETYGWQKYIAPSNKSDRKGGLVPYSDILLGRWAKRIKEQAGINDEVKMMDLRRTAVTEMIEAEVPLPNIMAMTGHATPQSVAPYMKHTLKGAMVAAKARGFI